MKTILVRNAQGPPWSKTSYLTLTYATPRKVHSATDLYIAFRLARELAISEEEAAERRQAALARVKGALSKPSSGPQQPAEGRPLEGAGQEGAEASGVGEEGGRAALDFAASMRERLKGKQQRFGPPGEADMNEWYPAWKDNLAPAAAAACTTF